MCIYLQWVRRYCNHCHDWGCDPLRQLTRSGAIAFAHSYVGPRRRGNVKESTRECARNGLHAWSCALKSLGVAVPPWRPPRLPERRSGLLAAYEEYRQTHRGVSARTLIRDVQVASQFLRMLRSHRRSVAKTRVADLDRFVKEMLGRVSRRTVVDSCSSLRCFLRFLQATGRLERDLASCVVAPRFRMDECPPRALPWDTVRSILRAIPQGKGMGMRDFAMFLLMATYGLGGAEVAALRLDDVDWRARILNVRRAKTSVILQLPLLPGVARALSSYLQRARPRHVREREIFVSKGLPHRPLSTAAMRHRLRHYAQRAGVVAEKLGCHVFRHSHATRQIDSGANPKIVSDILGHLRPSSTSAYVRVALRRLRTVALPVPR